MALNPSILANIAFALEDLNSHFKRFSAEQLSLASALISRKTPLILPRTSFVSAISRGLQRPALCLITLRRLRKIDDKRDSSFAISATSFGACFKVWVMSYRHIDILTPAVATPAILAKMETGSAMIDCKNDNEDLGE